MEKTNPQNVNQRNMKINRQNENPVGRVIHQSVGVRIALTSHLPVIESPIEKELIPIQDWITTTYLCSIVFFIPNGPSAFDSESLI